MFSDDMYDPFSIDSNEITDFEIPSQGNTKSPEEGQKQAMAGVSEEMAKTFSPDAVGDIFATAGQAVQAHQAASTAPLTQQLQSTVAQQAQGQQQFQQQFAAAQRPILSNAGLGGTKKWLVYGLGALAVGGLIYFVMKKRR